MAELCSLTSSRKGTNGEPQLKRWGREGTELGKQVLVHDRQARAELVIADNAAGGGDQHQAPRAGLCKALCLVLIDCDLGRNLMHFIHGHKQYRGGLGRHNQSVQ